MEEQRNLTQDDVLDLIGGEGFPEQPLGAKVIITLNRDEPDGNLVLSENVMSEVQFIVAKGAMVRDVEVGQKVRIDIEKMMVTVGTAQYDTHEPIRQIRIDPIVVDGVMYGIIEDRLIKTKVLR